MTFPQIVIVLSSMDFVDSIFSPTGNLLIVSFWTLVDLAMTLMTLPLSSPIGLVVDSKPVGVLSACFSSTV